MSATVHANIESSKPLDRECMIFSIIIIKHLLIELKNLDRYN